MKNIHEVPDLLNRILAVEQEQEMRKSFDTLSDYNTGSKVHNKQLEFHKCKKRNRWVFGGNRSGKTECGAVEAIWLARGIHPYRQNKPDTEGWVVSVSYQVQREVAQKKILHYLNPLWIHETVMEKGRKDYPEAGIIDTIIINNVFGGTSKIGFKSCDQGREKFQGASLDFVWFDEEPPRDIYDECRMRVLDKKGEIFGTMTPLKGQTWVYDEIYLNKPQNPETCHFMMEWADNPFLPEEEVEMLSEALDKDTLESRRFGRFKTDGGMVYGEFDQSVHVIEPFDVPSGWKDGISIDPGLHNPLACLFFAVDYDGTVYVCGEHYESGRDIGYHIKEIEKLADFLKWPRDMSGRLHALIDSAAGQHTLAYSKSVAELFYEGGIIVNTRVQKNLFSGIARVKSLFAAKRLYIFSNCTNLIKEVKTYAWGKGEAPIKRDDHALDALRYYIMSRPEPPKLPEAKTIITKDKERIIKKHGNQRKKIR